MTYIYIFTLFSTHQLENRTQTRSVLLHARVVHFFLVKFINFVAHDCQDDVFGAVGL